jgi:glycosyltransferase involved in cell wall biosynthesis
MYQGVATMVCSDGGGLLEHVRDLQTGSVVGSIDEMATRLAELLRDDELRTRLGANGRAFITSRYTLARMIDSYNDLYRVALERFGGKHR